MRRMAPRWRRCSSPAARGFIGSNLVRALLERGDDVRVLDNFSTGNRANLDRARRRGRRGRAAQLRARAQRRPRHRGRLPPRRARLGAALGAGPAHLERGQRRGHAERPARRARRGRAPRRLRVELVGLRHAAARCPAREDAPPDPISPYGVAKLAAERYCISFSPRLRALRDASSLRYFNVFGPRQSPFSQYAAVVPLFITAIAARRAGDDLRRRRAVARLHLRRRTSSTATLRAGDAAGASGRIFNVAASAPASVNELADTIGRSARQARREARRAAARRRHPRLVGRRHGGARDARLRAAVGLEEGLRLHRGRSTRLAS